MLRPATSFVIKLAGRLVVAHANDLTVREDFCACMHEARAIFNIIHSFAIWNNFLTVCVSAHFISKRVTNRVW